MHAVVVAVILAAVQVGGIFGLGSASGTELGPDLMQIELQVEAPPGGSVVAHLVEPGGPQQTVALREREDGRYGAFVELRRIDYVVVFEAVGEGTGSESAAFRLTELGLDRTILGMAPLPPQPPATPAPPAGEEPVDIGWLALAAAAGALALGLVVFALLPRTRS